MCNAQYPHRSVEDKYAITVVYQNIIDFITHIFFPSFDFSPTSLILASIAFFFILYERKSWYILSTRNVMLPVSSEVIFATRVGRCSSGNAVLGAGVTLTRFADGVAAVAMLEDAIGIESPTDASKRPGTGGTAKVENVSFIVFCTLSAGVEMNVKGSIGYGVSKRELFSYSTTTRQHRHKPLKSWMRY